MDLVDGLKAFVATAQTGSFTDAAERMGISNRLTFEICRRTGSADRCATVAKDHTQGGAHPGGGRPSGPCAGLAG